MLYISLSTYPSLSLLFFSFLCYSLLSLLFFVYYLFILSTSLLPSFHRCLPYTNPPSLQACHPVFESLKGTEDEWLYEMIQIFDEGDPDKYEKFVHLHSTQLESTVCAYLSLSISIHTYPYSISILFLSLYSISLFPLHPYFFSSTSSPLSS